MKNLIILLLAVRAGAYPISADDNGKVSIQTLQTDNICVNSGGPGSCGAVNGGVNTGGVITIPTLNASGGGTIGGPLTVIGSATVQGNAFSVGGSTFVVSGGKVGIGTASPATTLDVNGSAQFGSGATKSTFTATGSLQVPYGVTAGSVTISRNLTLTDTVTGEYGATFNNNSVNGFGVKINGGTTDSQYALRVRNAGDTSDLLTVGGGGSVGIGTTSPATTLDVNGSAQFGSGATKSTFTATGYFELTQLTLSGAQAASPSKAGDMIECSNCTDAYAILVGTGTSTDQWREQGTTHGAQ